MDVSPYLRKPLRSLQEVVDTLKPASPEAASSEGTAASEPESAVGDPQDAPKS
jgi:hypothetical protein